MLLRVPTVCVCVCVCIDIYMAIYLSKEKEGMLGEEADEQSRSRARPGFIGWQAVGVDTGCRRWYRGRSFIEDMASMYNLMARRSIMAIGDDNQKKVSGYLAGSVSSHIQVLARKKVREYQVGIKAMNLDQVSKDKALQSMASMSSAQIVSASVLQNKFSPPSPLPQAVFSTSSRFWSSPPLLGQQPGPSQDIKPFAQPAYPIQPPLPPTLSSYEPLTPLPPAAASVPVWQDRTIASSRLRLLEYSAFMEVQRDPDTVVTSRDSQETLLVIAFVFEVSTSEHGAQHHVYKLVKD
ncbi:tea domain family member 3-like [Lynx pardinus]|uniref:Tea domain family member 3-like n=1 Tax=Lynx pardinus TaxID=191816 RepID=A0A485MD46_LYNPA|nr:tea domain family member 3-like [Lynx pardinus]